MIAAITHREGRASRRALSMLLPVLLCLAGLALMLHGAIIPAKARIAQILLTRAFDHSLAAGQPVKPWSWADTAPVARVSVPRLGISEIVLSGGSGQAMAFGPTLLPGPHHVSVMAAHRDTHFAFLEHVRPGDDVHVQTIDGQTAHYRITRSQVVRWDGFARPSAPARPLLALTTCYPFGATQRGPLRYVLWAEQV
ncbi:MAG: class GN sortase [Sphingobium sp.]